MRRRAALVSAAAGFLAAALGAQTFEIVHAFSASYGEPQAPLVAGRDGSYYGTAKSGGFFGKGCVYTLTPQAGGDYAFEELHAFSGPDGAGPIAPLVEAADGTFYGTTFLGGATDAGTVFSIDAAGRLTTLWSFSGTDGSGPSGGLIEGGDGRLYGTTSAGGSANLGTIFRIDQSGALAVLHEFQGYPIDGSAPLAALLRASDGRLYGTASDGGSHHQGTIFRIDLAGNYQTVAEFDGANGAYPQSSLIRASNGYFYGVALYGGVFRVGYLGGLVEVPTPNVFGEMHAALLQASDGMLYGSVAENFASEVFRLSPDGSDVQIVGDVPSFPFAALLELPDGRLAAPATNGTVFAIDRFGAVDVLHRFLTQDGSGPWGALTEGSDGLLYGTTLGGGASALLGGWGTVFRMSLDGALEILHSFDGTDGFGPMEKLLEASDGGFWGTTADPGSGSSGTAFRIDAAGAFDFLHSFGYPEGTQPAGALAEGAGGRIFGVLYEGGDQLDGTIYEIDASGTVTKRHDFDGTGGAGPIGLLADAGHFYGVTRFGGDTGYGTLFQFDPDTTVARLWSFTGGADGGGPRTALIRASDGSLYGGTASTIFRWADPGPPVTVHDFGDAEYPSGLVEADGVFYGTTQTAPGTVFRMNSAGATTTLHAFSGPDGSSPAAEPTVASDGNLYGTAPYGGPSGAGVVWTCRLGGAAGVEVASIAPSSGRAAGATSIAVAGSGFQPLLALTVGGAAAGGVIDVDRGHARAVAPPLSAGTLNDVTVTNPDTSTATLSAAFFADFLDVPSSHPFHGFVESIVRAGITAGCGGGNYCPTAAVTRAQMAVFLLKAEHGPAYAPPACTGVFADAPCPGPFTDWIEQLANEGVTGGCGGGNYCPASPVTRAQMAVFLLKTLLGASYTPPPASGIFGDVPPGSFAADWIEDLYARQITGGCSSSPLLYCPNGINTRGQMAVFLAKTFSLP